MLTYREMLQETFEQLCTEGYIPKNAPSIDDILQSQNDENYYFRKKPKY